MRSSRRVIFLDFDGVLNSHHSTLFDPKMFRGGVASAGGAKKDDVEDDLQRMLNDIDPRLAFNLGFVIKNVPGLEIVISSTWREVFKIDRFKLLFERLGLPDGIVIGKTPTVIQGQKFSERVTRIAQIYCYMKEAGLTWPEVVIIDDNNVAGGGSRDSAYIDDDGNWRERFIQTDNLDGLTYRKAWDVILKFIPASEFNPPMIMM